MNFWCQHAWLGGETTAAGVLLTVDGGRIAAVEVDAAPHGTVLRGLTLPGLANAHSHAFHRALRGRTHGGGGTFWTWREQMYALAGRLDPDSYRDLATAVFAEMVLAGYTCVGEFHYLHHAPDGRPYRDPNAMGHALLDAAAVAGMRITLLDACYLHGGIGTEPSGVQRRFSDGTAEAWSERMSALRGGPQSRVGAAIHSVRAVDPAAMAMVAGIGGPLHAHVSEQPAENEQCRAAYGCTPTELLGRAGVLGERFTAVHATHLTGGDIAALRDSTVCVCPTTERELADGIGPTAALAAGGTTLCTGSDSHAVIDPFEEARAVELDERLTSKRRGTHSPAALLSMSTAGGYRSLGWAEGGVIAEGALADFVTIGLDSPRLAGSDVDALPAAAVFAASAPDVRHVVVDGEVVVDGGEHRRLDVAKALSTTIGALWA